MGEKKKNFFQHLMFWKQDRDEPSEVSTIHLYVLVHGMWGAPSDLICLQENIEEIKDSQDLILVSGVNKRLKSYHGIDVCGNRLAREVKKYVRKRSKESIRIGKISFIGFSAGGIFIRYAIGVLYEQRFFERISPAFYVSLASPHLGIRQSHKMRSGQFLNMVADATSNVCGGRTMDQLCLLDNNHNPLILQMSLPNSVFVAGLSLFTCSIYANVSNDKSTPFCTAGLAKRNPYRQYSSRHQIPSLTGYEYICKEELVDINEVIEPEDKRFEVNTNKDDIAADLVFNGCLLPLWFCQGLCIFPSIRPFSGSFDEKDTHSRDKNPAFEFTPDWDSSGGHMQNDRNTTSKRSSMVTRTTEPCSKRSSLAATEDVGFVSQVPLSSTTDFNDSFEDIPMKIRENLLSEIPFTRVDCWLPGIHTHSKMIVREGLECFGEGKEIMRHVALKITCKPVESDFLSVNF